MFQPNVEEIGITSNLLLTDGRFVLRRGVKTGNLGTSTIKCKLNGQCNCWSYHYFISHKSHVGLHSQAVTEKQLQAIIRSSDLNIKAPKNAGCKGNKEKKCRLWDMHPWNKTDTSVEPSAWKCFI